MVSGKLFLSEKAKVSAGNDLMILLKKIEDVVKTHSGYSASVGNASSVLGGQEVSLDLFDLNNISGVKLDLLSLKVKFEIGKFFLSKSLVVLPKNIRITCHSTVTS